MKLFITFILKIFLIIIFSNILSYFYSRFYYFNFYDGAHNIRELAFFGDSRIAQNIDTIILNRNKIKYRNFSYSGESTINELLKLRLLNDYKGIVFFEISNDIYQTKSEEFKKNIKRRNIVLPLFNFEEIREYRVYNSILLKFHIPKFRMGLEESFYNYKDHNINDSIISKNHNILKLYSNLLDTSIENYIVNELIKFRSRNPDSKLFLLRTPIYIDCKNSVLMHEIHFKNLKERFKKHKIKMIDLYACDGLSKVHFKDCYHLNYSGRVIFTKILIDKIQ